MIDSHLKALGRTIWLLIILKSATKQASAGGSCRPVYMLHGLFDGAIFMDYIVGRIKQDYPETDIFNSNAYSYLGSFTALYDQINGQVGQEFLAFNAKHPDGITILGHSQGALILRSLCEIYSNHSVHTLISIAGPQRGGYGIGTFNAQVDSFLQIPPALELQTDFYYTERAQRTYSFTNYWNDPLRHEEYLQKNIFLPVVNNEVQSNRSELFKEGFLKLQRQVTIGGPDDGLIIPWQSSQYSYFGNAYPAVDDYRDSEIYQKDTFGLRTLDETGGWTRLIFPGLNHVQFIFSDAVYTRGILPFLDCKPEPPEETKKPEGAKEPDGYKQPGGMKYPEAYKPKPSK